MNTALEALGPTEINGLPAHVLLIHLTVVALPAAAAATVASAAWPAARRRLGIGTPLIALVALICVPLTVSAGEWLYARVGHTAALDHHEALGHDLLPWAIALFVVAVVEYLWFAYGAQRFLAQGTDGASLNTGAASGTAGAGTVAITAVAVILALVVAVGSVVQVYRIGDSGARAVWKGSFSKTPISQSHS